MNEEGKTTLDTFSSTDRMRKDMHFKNIIIKNSCRLRQKSNDDCNSRGIKEKEPELRILRRRIKYNRIEKNNFNKSIDNISIDLNSNFMKQNRSKRKFFLDLNFDKDEQTSFAETERKRENIFIKNSIDKPQIIRVNQNKTMNINSNNIGNIIRKEKIIENKYPINNNDGPNIHNSEIKQIITDLKEDKNNTNNKKKVNMKRYNSIRKIMNNLYYNSYLTDKKNCDNKEKTLKKEKSKKLNLNNNNNHIFKDSENIVNRKIINVKSNNSYFIKDNNNLKTMKLKSNKKIEDNYKSINDHIYIQRKNLFGNILNKDIHTFSTEDNSILATDENKEIIKTKKYEQNLIKVKMVCHKLQKQLNEDEKLTKYKNSINQKIIIPKLMQSKINNKIYETIPNKINGKDKNQISNLISPRLKYEYKRMWNFRYKEDDNDNDKINLNYVKNKKIESNMNYNFNNTIEQNSDLNLDKIKVEIKDSNFLVNFFDDIIQLCEGIKEKTIFEKLVKKINKKYLIDYDKISSEINLIDAKNNFSYSFKIFCIILICFCFLSKDNALYKENFKKIYLLFSQYIYSSLFLFGYHESNCKSIKSFLKDYNSKKNITIFQCADSIVRLLFQEKEEYISLNKILNQLKIKSRNSNIKEIINIIKETILFCFNQIKFYKIYPNNLNNNNFYSNYFLRKENNTKKIGFPTAPFIKANLRKKFCLVLDMDETILHSIKMNFGNYFFLRPGTLEFLNELSQFYEIIIFTSSPKEYADDILDKIDPNGNLISHRLYKSHVLFEKGKSVKKLELIGRDLNKIIFVDNLKYNAKYNLKNLYLIPSWTDNIYDNEIYKLKKKLKYIFESGKYNDDVTKAL